MRKTTYYSAGSTRKSNGSGFSIASKSNGRLPNFNVPRFVKGFDKKTLIFLNRLVTFGLGCVLFGIFSVFVIFAYYSYQLPNPDQLIARNEELSTRLFDRNGNILYEVYAEKNRTLIKIDQVSQNMVHATLATEDADFYLHNGFSIRGILRAARNTIFGGEVQGGSTLTQQVARTTLLTQERTLTRKIKELILSLQIENIYSKEQILQMYLNETPYGGQNYGVVSAAKFYFNKPPSELTVAEAAYIAGLAQSPTYYSSNSEAGTERKNYVLYLMKERGWTSGDGKRYYLSEEEYEKARTDEIKFQAASIPFNAPHFVFNVKQELAERFGDEAVEQGGLQVTTTIDLDMQNTAQEIVYNEVQNSGYLNVHNGALVVLDPKTGQILSMVGSKGFTLESEPAGCIPGITGENSCLFDPQVNVATSLRQPGSTIKPITYAAMLSQGYTAAYPFLDVPTAFPGSSPDKPYNPVNYDGSFRGPVSLRRSLGSSLNIPAVKALKIVGVDNMIDTAEKMGITSLKDRNRYGLALTLGGGEVSLLEMTGAFATFANKGTYKKPTGILEVKDASGNLLYKQADNPGTQAISEEVAFLIADILSDDGARSLAFGTNSLLNIPNYQVAVKTGTTDDKRDNYAIGFTPSVVVGSWVGNSNNEEMNPALASGISGATPIWRKFMLSYLEGKENEKFEAPSRVEKMEVDSLTGMLPFGEAGRRSEWFIEGTKPTAISTWYKQLEICEVDGRLASDDCRDADKTEVKTFAKVTAEIPEWQLFVDRWVQENYSGDDFYYPPTMVSKLEFDGDDPKDDQLYVAFAGLKDGDRVPLNFRLSVEVSASNDIDNVKIYKNGDEVTDDNSEPFGYNFSFSSGEAGEYEFRAKVKDEDDNEAETSIRLRVGN